MHPAYSVIFFTTASGAGYGLLFWLLAGIASGRLPQSWWLGLLGFGLGLGLVTGGLLASTFHLGRPERAWRAFSQWRTSWLSREGVLAVASFAPIGLLGLDRVLGPLLGGLSQPVAVIGIVLIVATVWATGMIYASLPTIRAWHQPLVAPLYVLLALATGGVLLNLLLAVTAGMGPIGIWLALASVLVAWVAKAAYWHAIDTEPRTLTVGSATGLGRYGRVRPLEPAHTGANFVMREMGYAIARNHADKLRTLVVLLSFLVPGLCLTVALVAPAGLAQAALMLLATVCAGAGVLTERWLFFAEARHAVTLYYGQEAA